MVLCSCHSAGDLVMCMPLIKGGLPSWKWLYDFCCAMMYETANTWKDFSMVQAFVHLWPKIWNSLEDSQWSLQVLIEIFFYKMHISPDVDSEN